MKPARQEHRTWDKTAETHCSLGAARGQLEQLCGAGQHCTGMWGRRKGARLGWFRAAGQDQAVLAKPAGRGSCWWLRKRLAVQVTGLEQESRVSVEFPCCFPPALLSLLLLLGPFPPPNKFLLCELFV